MSRYCGLIKNDFANGPGVRISIFISGCKLHCKGCFSPKTWDFLIGDLIDDNFINDVIIKELSRNEIAGLSILGGNPTEDENIDAVNEIIRKIREIFNENKSIWVWSGYIFEDLKSRGDKYIYFLNNIDVLVDGPFIEAEHDARLAWRGSVNQRIIDSRKSMMTNSIVLYGEEK